MKKHNIAFGNMIIATMVAITKNAITKHTHIKICLCSFAFIAFLSAHVITLSLNWLSAIVANDLLINFVVLFGNLKTVNFYPSSK